MQKGKQEKVCKIKYKYSKYKLNMVAMVFKIYFLIHTTHRETV